MSTKLLDDKMSITSFYGGKKRGRCIQFTIENEYAQYEEDEVKNIHNILNKWLEKHTE